MEEGGGVRVGGRGVRVRRRGGVSVKNRCDNRKLDKSVLRRL